MSEQNELTLSGAPSTLKYLQNSVSRAQKRLDEAHANLEQALLNQRDKPDELNGEDFEIAIARARAEFNDAELSYLRQSKSQLEYDKNVDTNRRDVSESITKADAERFFFSFAICMRGAVEQIATRQAQDAMEVKSPEDMFKIVAPLLRECFSSALKSACDESHVPPWVKTAIENAL